MTPDRDAFLPPTRGHGATVPFAPKAAAAAPRKLAAWAAVLATALGACGREETSRFSDYGGLLGSCTAGEGLRFDPKSDRAAVSCTEHTYSARGSTDPAGVLAPSYAAACKDGGGAWKTGGCEKGTITCAPRAEDLSLRTAEVVHNVRTTWRAAGSFTLAPKTDAKLLCR